MDLPHGRDDAYLRPRYRRQLSDLAAHVHSHLQNHGLVLGTQTQDGQRQADFIVGVALALECHEALGQDGGDRFLGGGLGDAAGHADHERREASAPRGGHGMQAQERVRDGHNGRSALPRQVGRFAGQVVHEEVAWPNQP